MWKHMLGVSLLALLLAACNSDDTSQRVYPDSQPINTQPEAPSDGDEQTSENEEPEEEEPVKVEPLTRFTVANKCIAIRPAGADQWLVRSDSGGYVASAERS